MNRQDDRVTDLHIGDFYRDTALTLVRLYQIFPRPVILYVDDICGPDEPDEFGLHSDRYMSCFNTLIWLGAEGYLRYVDIVRQEALDQTVLTERGLRLLCGRSSLSNIAPIDPDTPAGFAAETQSNIQHVRRALQSGSSTQLEHCMHYLLHEQP